MSLWHRIGPLSPDVSAGVSAWEVTEGVPLSGYSMAGPGGWGQVGHTCTVDNSLQVMLLDCNKRKWGASGLILLFCESPT
jgi:hypothetical protein